jgi:hypothetical protein
LLPATVTLITAVVAMSLVVRTPRIRQAVQPDGFDRRGRSARCLRDVVRRLAVLESAGAASESVPPTAPAWIRAASWCTGFRGSCGSVGTGPCGQGSPGEPVQQRVGLGKACVRMRPFHALPGCSAYVGLLGLGGRGRHRQRIRREDFPARWATGCPSRLTIDIVIGLPSHCGGSPLRLTCLWMLGAGQIARTARCSCCLEVPDADPGDGRNV